MGYLNELRANWRSVAGATLGLGSGLSLIGYVNSAFAPALIGEFGWKTSQFALLGAFGLLTMISIPFIGRLTDVFGVKKVAFTGICVMPLSFAAASLMTGEIIQFYAIAFVQTLFAATTTATVYSRLIAECITLARGLALAIAASGPAVVGAVGSPILNGFIEDYGWRAGYMATAAFSALAGGLALVLAPRSPQAAAPRAVEKKRSTREDYAEILKNHAFWILAVSGFLVTFPFALAQSQLAVMLSDHDVTPAQAALMVSVFATGVVVGRFGLGLALDRFPTHIVAACGMGLTALGVLTLASDVDSFLILAAAVTCMGLSYGAESDILGFAVMRYFRVEVYSSVMGLITASLGLAISSGSIFLSYTLDSTGSFKTFMLVSGTMALIGSLNLLRLRDPGKAAEAV